MISTIRHGGISWLGLLALLAFFCSLQVGPNGLASALKSPFWRHKKARVYDDYDSSSDDHRETRRQVKLLAAGANWESYSKSPLFVEPADDGVTQIPPKQLEFEYEAGRKNIALFKEILLDAIAKRDDIFSGTKLITKWGLKLIQVMIKNRRDEMAIKDRYEPRKFFRRMADALEKLVSESTKIKHSKGYDRKNVDIKEFEKRSMEILDYADRVLELSPVGVFLKWDTMKLYMDDPKHPHHKKDGMEEASDLFAQFRAIGYDSAVFMANRVVDVLKAFDKGDIPSSRRFA